MPWWYHAGGGFAYWWIFPLFFGGVWVVVIGLGIWLLVRLGLRGGREGDAMTTLRERFARGEIDADEYQQRAKLLGDR